MMVFEAVMNNGKMIKIIFDSINQHFDEAILKFTKKGLEMIRIDEGRIALIHLTIPHKDFDEYKCDKNLNIGLQISQLMKMMNRLQPDESIKFGYDDANKKLVMTMFTESKKNRRRTFKLGLIDLTDQDVHTNLLEEAVSEGNEATLPLDYIIESIKDAEIMSETLTIGFSERELKFSTMGMIGDVELVVEKDDEGVEDFVSKSPGEATFALNYMTIFKRARTLTEKVKITHMEDAPLRVNFSFLTESFIVMFISPRINQEEGEEEDYDTQY